MTNNNDNNPPREIAQSMFNKVMKEFEKQWNEHPINDDAEQAFLKHQAEKQQHLEDAFSRVDFDMQKGTLIKIDLGPPDSPQREKWKYSAYRPEGLHEGDILLYSGWFKKAVKVFNEVIETEEKHVIPYKTTQVELETPKKESIEDEDLSDAFSTRVQLFIKAGAEEIWTGLIPDFYYVTLAEGSGGACEEPLFVQQHGLTLNRKLINTMIEADMKTLEARKLQTLPDLTPSVQKKQLRKAVKQKYDEEHEKASEEAKLRWEKAQRGELAKSLKK